jgi:hypothetical protein
MPGERARGAGPTPQASAQPKQGSAAGECAAADGRARGQARRAERGQAPASVRAERVSAAARTGTAVAARANAEGKLPWWRAFVRLPVGQNAP